MIWTITQTKAKRENQLKNGNRMVILLAVIAITSAGFAYFHFFRQTHSEEMHPYIKFKDKLKEVCANPRLPMLEYKGVESFFNYLLNPDRDYCYSWLEFGGEKIIIPFQAENSCLDEVRKSKFMCFNEEYEMTKDPCLVYSFTKDADQQFERDMHMFSCHVHVFDAQQVIDAEHVQRTEFWLEHGWDIGEYPYDKKAEKQDHVKNKEGVLRRRSLDFIAHTLGHEGEVIKFIKSDNEGREWILLKQIVTHHDLVDVRQIGVRLHLPIAANTMTGTARHEYFRELFEIFQGLNCLGYKYILARPVNYYKGAIRVPEVNRSLFPSYEVNFAKVLPTVNLSGKN